MQTLLPLPPNLPEKSASQWQLSRIRARGAPVLPWGPGASADAWSNGSAEWSISRGPVPSVAMWDPAGKL